MDAMQLHDVRMIAKRPQEHNLAECSLGIRFVAESVEDFLHRNRLMGFLVDGLPNNSVRSFAESLMRRASKRSLIYMVLIRVFSLSLS